MRHLKLLPLVLSSAAVLVLASSPFLSLRAQEEIEVKIDGILVYKGMPENGVIELQTEKRQTRGGEMIKYCNVKDCANRYTF